MSWFSRAGWVGFFLLFIFISPFNVIADPVSFEFTATVTEVHRNLTSMTELVGETGTGRVTYDLKPGITSLATNTKIYGYESPPAHFEFTIAGHTYVAGTEPHTPVSASDSDVFVEVTNDRQTWYQVPISDRIRYWGLWIGQTIDDHPIKMELILNDQTSALLNDTHLPNQCPTLTDFDGYPTTQFVIMIDLSDTTSTFGIQFTVDSITPISNPEPHRLTITIPESATEGDGVLTTQGRLDVTPAPDVDIRVTLVSDDVSELSVPPYIMVAANSTTATFDLSVNDDVAVDGTQLVEIKASNDIYGSSIQSISIIDNDQADGGGGGDDDGGGNDSGGGNDGGGGDDNGQGVDPPAAFDLTGPWNVTEIADETDCGEGVNTKQYTVTLTQNGTSVRAQTPYGTFNGRINGQEATWSGLGSEDGGTLDTNIRATITINANGNSFTGSETWSWSDGISQCSGTSELSGIRQGSGNIGTSGSDGGDSGGGGGGGCFVAILP